MPFDHFIPVIEIFQNLALEIEGQGNGWSQDPKWQSDFLPTHIPLVPYQSSTPFLQLGFFEI